MSAQRAELSSYVVAVVETGLGKRRHRSAILYHSALERQSMGHPFDSLRSVAA
jgi:hypothetical protein